MSQNADDETVRRIKEIMGTGDPHMKEPPLFDYQGTLFGSDYVVRRSDRIPFELPNLNYRPHAERADAIETMLLQKEVQELRTQNAALLAIVSKLLGWFTRRPKSQSVKGGYTAVPRLWWMTGEKLLGSITLPVQAAEKASEKPNG